MRPDRSLNCHADLLYWYIKEDNVEAALSLVQKEAVELFEYIRAAVDNPFIQDTFNPKDGASPKALKVFKRIERLYELMSTLEKEFEERGDFSEYVDEPPMHPKQSPTKPAIPSPSGASSVSPAATSSQLLPTRPRKFKITTPLSKKEVEQVGSFACGIHDCLNKMK